MNQVVEEHGAFVDSDSAIYSGKEFCPPVAIQ